MTVALVQATPDSKLGYQGYGAVCDFWRYQGPEVLLMGPYQCVAGETLIYDPTTGTESPIAELARRGEPITVLTMLGPRSATPPFRKGTDDLYRVTTKTGRSFVATARHRVLTARGWTCVSELASGDSLPAYAPSPQESSSEPVPSGFQRGVLDCFQTLRDCQGDCSACLRPYGGQLPGDRDSDQESVPSRAGVLERSCDGHGSGVLGTSPVHSRLDQSCAHPSSGDGSPLFASDVPREYCVSGETCEPSGALSRCGALSRLASHHHLPIAEFRPHDHSIPPSLDWEQDQPFLLRELQHRWGSRDRLPPCGCLACADTLQRFGYISLSHLQACLDSASQGDAAQLFCNYTAHIDTVASVEYERTDEYYDMHVPGAEHYFAQGFFHHNTGKTIACLQKLNALLAKYQGARALMVRRTYASLVGSAVVTYERKVLPYPPGHPKCAVRKLGASKPEMYLYPNGSSITLGGLDNPDKFLSAEFDYVYINQAEELRLDDYEKLSGRATGRAGNAPYPQVMADCNPDVPTHWLLSRDRLLRLSSRHEDNPTLFDPDTGAITPLGTQSLEALDALTGVRYKRGRLGLWVGVEGMVYEEWNRDTHLIDRFEIPKSWRRLRAIDFGFTNPFVCQWWALDEDDRMYLYRELYMSQRTVKTHAAQIAKLSEGERYIATVADHDAEDRATLYENGIETLAADKRITVGIEKVQERLKVQADGRPRLFLLRDSLIERDPLLEMKFKPLRAEDEFPAYAYSETKSGKPSKEEPVDMDNHGLDALRYAVMFVDGSRGKETPPPSISIRSYR